MAGRIPLLVIGGPTAAGKTTAAIRTARAVGAEIISADSMQIHKDMAIGTAQPDASERRSARIHLIDFVEPDAPYSVADFQQAARRIVINVFGRGNLPILCGGSGLYIRALLQHFDFPPAEPAQRARVRQRLQQQIQRQGSQSMHSKLAAIDPPAADDIDETDEKRIIRALEVYELTGERFSDRRRVDAEPPVRYNPLYYVLNRPRQQLYRAIEQRVDDMLDDGWIDEVRRLQQRGLKPSDQAMQAIGYSHLLQWLNDGESAEELPHVIQTIKRDTRQFAKRQLTWFRGEQDTITVCWQDRADYNRILQKIITRARQLKHGGAVTETLNSQHNEGES